MSAPGPGGGADPGPPGAGAFDPPAGELGGRLARGAVATYASQGTRLGIQFASVVVMSRLLAPADFGVFAMVAPIAGLANVMQDLGLGAATIQRPRITAGQISTLFWINLAAACLLALALVLLAPAIGRFYSDPRTGGLACGFAGLMVVNALSAQHCAILSRRMRFQYLAWLDLGSFALGTASGVAAALVLRNCWALLAGPAVSAATTAIGAWIGAGFVPGAPRPEGRLGELVRVGGGVAGFNMFGFVARNLDNVLIGHAWGGQALGLYDRAYKLLLFPLHQASSPLGRVLLPALARLQDDPEKYRTLYLRSLRQLLIATQPGIVFTIATADVLVPALLGEQWRGAAPIFQWLGVAALQQLVTAATTWLFVSQGRSDEYAQFGAFNAATSAGAFLAGLPWGPVGVAAAYSATQICLRMPVMWWMATRRGPVRLADLRATVLPHAAATAASFAAVAILRAAAPMGTAGTLAACLAMSYAAALSMLALTSAGRGMLRETEALILRARSAAPGVP